MKDSELSLLERVSDAFVALDEELRFVFVNHQAAHILEQDSLALIGKKMGEAFPDLIGDDF